jgi:uncharacterized protein YgbK (DUF1537 family)
MIRSDNGRSQMEAKGLSLEIAKSLAQGHVLLKTRPERIMTKDPTDLPFHLRITETLGQMALFALKASRVEVQDLALVLIGGDTALGVIHGLEADGIKIENEILEGIAMGHLMGGPWQGVKVITKAGAFGKEDTLERIMEILERGPLEEN